VGLPVSITAPRRFPLITAVIVSINVLIFALQYINPSLLVPGARSAIEVQLLLGVIPAAIVRGDRLWSLITCLFVHGDLFHILGNMLFLVVFGSAVESVVGRLKFLALYIASGVVASVFHIISIAVIPREYNLLRVALDPWITPAMGASGAISGVLGVYVVYFPRSRVTAVYPIVVIPVVLSLPACVYAIMWFTYQFVMAMLSVTILASSVAYWAHIGGFLAGVGLAPYMLSENAKLWIRIRRTILQSEHDIADSYRDEEIL